MDKNQLKRLAGLPVITEKQWSGKVETKKTPPKGLFADGTKAEICKWLKDNHKDYAGAMSALNFYINRAGRNLDVTRRAALEACKDELRKAYGVKEALEPFDIQLLRRMAGLATESSASVLVVEKEEDEVRDKAKSDAAPESESCEEGEDEMPAIIAKIAAKVEGKTGDELIELIQKVYNAGFKDGEEAHKAEDKSKQEGKEEIDFKGSQINEDMVTEAADKPETAKPAPLDNITSFIGVDKEDDAGWMAVELAKAGITVDMEEAMGVFYFNFKNKADEAKAVKLAEKLQIALV